jgi:D-aspartate ligase
VLRPAVVFGLDRSGLALARALGRGGVTVTGVTWQRTDFGVRSRYVRRCHVLSGRDERGREEVVRILRELGRTARPVLLLDSDDAIELVLTRWDEIRELADVPLPDDPAITQELRRKERLPFLAERAGVPSPATVSATDEATIRAADLRPPLLVKPVEGKAFQAVFHQKAFGASDVDEAVAAWRRADARGFDTIVQELIPDTRERIFSLFTYIGRDGEPRASLTGRKARQIPVDFGSATVFEVRLERTVLDLGLRLLRSAGYTGFAQVEFAQDARDGSFQALEVNTRAPVWVGVAAAGMPNIVRAGYDDLCGVAVPANQVVEDERVWVDLVLDLVQVAARRDVDPRRFAAPYLSRRKTSVFFAADDPLPVLAAGVALVTHALARRRTREA